MTAVLSDFHNHSLSIQQGFNMLERKINNLKTDAKASRIERLELINIINYFETNAHPDAIQNLIKQNIELEMRKEDLILN